MIALLVALALVAAPVHVAHPHRSKAVIAQFKREWSAAHGGLACPQAPPLDCRLWRKHGAAFVLYYPCGGCQVDHICALACGGADHVGNLRWLDAKANNRKSDDCSLCARKP